MKYLLFYLQIPLISLLHSHLITAYPVVPAGNVMPVSCEFAAGITFCALVNMPISKQKQQRGLFYIKMI